MSTKRRGLGRSLGALLSDMSVSSQESLPSNPTTNTNTSQGNAPVHLEGQLLQLTITSIQASPLQPRRQFAEEKIKELADSIKIQGILQPIVVRTAREGHYEIIAGERRFRAAQLAGLEKVPALVRELPDEAVVAMALIENIQREDLNPIEQAIAIERLHKDFSLTHEQIAHIIGKSRSSISNLLRLLSLNDDVKYLLEQGQLDMGHARALLSLAQHQQTRVAQAITIRGLSVREAEQYVRDILKERESPQNKPALVEHHLKSLFNHSLVKFNLHSEIFTNRKGHGKLVVHFEKESDLEKLLSLLNEDLN